MEKVDYDEEADEFLMYFDENGNFMGLPPEEVIPDNSIQITYHFKEKKENGALE